FVLTEIQRTPQSLGFGILARLPVGVGEVEKFFSDIALGERDKAAHRLDGWIKRQRLFHIARAVCFRGLPHRRGKFEFGGRDGVGGNGNRAPTRHQVKLTSGKLGSMDCAGFCRLAIRDRDAIPGRGGSRRCWTGCLAVCGTREDRQEKGSKRGPHGYCSSLSLCSAEGYS